MRTINIYYMDGTKESFETLDRKVEIKDNLLKFEVREAITIPGVFREKINYYDTIIPSTSIKRLSISRWI